MRRKIPSNSALMAFEVSARHGSFARAADELALTEGAISRQIGRLEAFLGITLFERVGNRVRLLPNGERYAVQVRESLDRLERDSQYLMGQPSDGASLDIATIPTFAVRWLIPRLARFQEKHPNITVHLAERMEPFVLAGSGFDAAIHFEHPAWSGMRTHRLLHETLVPVCHPALLGEEGAKSLDELPRLHRRQNPDAWQRYAQETGIALTNPAIGARYDLHSMLIEAALARLGVALVPRLYIEAELADGRLVAPWPDGVSISKTFCLILPEPIQLSDGPIQVFANWLLKETR
ncbi:LysR substrate-binding domain-containing protein [Beijerinckia indica]|uniref:Transcriptional regulator, LysR family n=1 Tax=Beijerinckia indica subsp. indica (strain ATCC 9039 / DSM 1715 / NCIMB 8712) TaxID=395963 RepID=B2IKZ4_BEII9|nr:LysR substrate-binding domain-containing protein [Beijerinckia indica]ACB96534.1 transcriptional regulator, LysR family [Beijerinckia indica subsp. indica ATCC 9039]